MTTPTFTPPFTPPDADNQATMVYTVDLGNGHVAEVEGPASATPQQLQAAVANLGASPDVPAPTEVQMAGDGQSNPLTQMSPADADQYRSLLHTADASTLLSFLERRGFASDPAKMARRGTLPAATSPRRPGRRLATTSGMICLSPSSQPSRKRLQASRHFAII